MTFENLLPRAKAVFYKAWISEATPEECKYYQDFFRKYPNRGNYTDFYKKALAKSVKVLFSSWDYETETTFCTPEALLQEIEAAENEYI